MSERTRIEEGLEQTRSRLDDHLNDLKAKLTPDRLVDDALFYMKGSDGAEFVRNLITGAKRNPIPATLAGIGLAWLMASNALDRSGSPDRAHVSTEPWTNIDDFDAHVGRHESIVVRGDDEDETTYTDRLNDARGKALGLAKGAQDTAVSYATKVGDAMTSTRERLTRQTHDARDRAYAVSQSIGDCATALQEGATDSARYANDRLKDSARSAQRVGGNVIDMVMDNPVILGAVGLGLGALIGAVLPRTNAEQQALGGIAGQARETFMDATQEAIDRGGAAVQAAAAKGQDSAEAHGLASGKTISDVMREAGDGTLSSDIAGVVKDAVAAADQTARERKPRM